MPRAKKVVETDQETAPVPEPESEATGGVGHNSSDLSIGFEDLRSILADIDDRKTTVGEATGRYRSHLKQILEEQTWNKTALGDILKINRMSETARADYLRTFRALFEVMCVNLWDDELRDMIDKMQEGGEEE